MGSYSFYVAITNFAGCIQGWAWVDSFISTVAKYVESLLDIELRTNMQVMATSLSPQTRIEFQNFSNWIISIGGDNFLVTKICEDGEANWIKIPRISSLRTTDEFYID